MATISTGGGEGGKRAVDHEVPLIPFIDLLLCCIMFLLVTAVWNKLSAVDANLEPNGPTQDPGVLPPDEPPAMLRVAADGYRIAGSGGDEIRIARADEATYDIAALREHLRARRGIDPNERAMIVTADDGVAYAELVSAMDALAGTGYQEVTVSGAQ